MVKLEKIGHSYCVEKIASAIHPGLPVLIGLNGEG